MGNSTQVRQLLFLENGHCPDNKRLHVDEFLIGQQHRQFPHTALVFLAWHITTGREEREDYARKAASQHLSSAKEGLAHN